MATESEPSSQLTTQSTGNFCKPESSDGNQVPADKPPAKKPVILRNCELCDVILNSQIMVEAHMASKKHKKKVRAAESMKPVKPDFVVKKITANTPLYRCDICNVTLNSYQQKEFHLAGTKHKCKVKKSAEGNEGFQQKEAPSITNHPTKMEEPAGSIRNTAKGVTAEKDHSVPVQPADLTCTVCKITVNSVQQLTQHLGSKKHKLKQNNVKLSPPYSRRKGGSSGAPGGRGYWGGGPKPGEVNSLASNFQSAGFTTNFQTSSETQSLKRDRSPFGNGNNDISNNSYHQGGKIPRGPHSTPFNSQGSMDFIRLSGINSFGGGNSSFGRANSFGSDNMSFGVDNNSFGSGGNSFSGNQSLGRGNSSFGGGNNFGEVNSFRGFSRGKKRGGPAKRGDRLRRGRGFGPRGGFGQPA